MSVVDIRGVYSRVSSIVRGSRDILAGSQWRHDPLTSGHCPAFDLGEPWYYDLSRSLERGDYRVRDDVMNLPATVRNGEWSHQPVLVLSYGIASLQRSLTSAETWPLAEATRVARWAAAEQEATGLHFVPMRFPLPDLPANWPCSIVQGLAMSLFARLGHVTGDNAWFAPAVAGLDIFETEIASGGVRSTNRKGGVWYDEYPFRKGGSRVLNGFIYSLLGLRDVSLLDVEGAPRAESLFQAGMKSLRDSISDYDAGYWSFYDCPDWRSGRLASQYYHRTHIALLDVLAQIDPHCEIWGTYRDRFFSYTDRPSNRIKALSKKLRDLSAN